MIRHKAARIEEKLACGEPWPSLQGGISGYNPDSASQRSLTSSARLEILAGHGTNQFVSATLGTDFLSLLRIVVGLILLQHGTQKLFHFPPPDRAMHGLTPLMTVAAWLELSRHDCSGTR
jgi:hypothetical protein